MEGLEDEWPRLHLFFCIPTVNQRHLFSLINNIQPLDIIFSTELSNGYIKCNETRTYYA